MDSLVYRYGRSCRHGLAVGHFAGDIRWDSRHPRRLAFIASPLYMALAATILLPKLATHSSLALRTESTALRNLALRTSRPVGQPYPTLAGTIRFAAAPCIRY